MSRNSAAVLFCLLVLCGFLFYGLGLRPTLAPDEPSITLVIDAGHGGTDGGAVAVDGTKESGLNLAIARKAAAVSVFLGNRTRMTRSEDVSLHTQDRKTVAQQKASDLKRRAEIVCAVPDAVLLSIHQNHFSQGKYRGAQVFYADTPGSRELASILQQELCTYADANNHRKIKPSQNVYLMQHVNCPAVMVECGFLSNSEDTMMLKDPDYQTKIAMILLHGITENEMRKDHEV